MTAAVCSRRRLLGSTLLIGLSTGYRGDPQGVVTSTDQLNRALANAQPGDEIVLADGNYAAPQPITRSGTSSSPIVIRAANLLGAAFTSGSIFIDASWVTLYGTDHVGSGVVRIGYNAAANDVAIWRCRFRDKTSGSAQAMRTYNAKRPDFAYCEVANWQGTGLLLGASVGTRNPVVRYCLFRDTPAGYQEKGSEAMRTLGARGIELGALFYRCKIHRWSGDANGETLKLSNSSCVVRQCVQDQCNPNGWMANRGGQNNLWDACWSKDSYGIGIHDGYLPDRVNKLLGCKSEGDDNAPFSGGIVIRGGTAEPGFETAGTHNLAEGCVVSGCDGPLNVNVKYSGHTLNVRNTRIRQHTGPINLLAGHQNTDSQPTADETLYEWSSLIWLENSDVGPFANLPA